MKKVVSLLLVFVLLFSLSFSCFASIDLSTSVFLDKITTLSNGVSFDFTCYFDFFTSILDNYLNSIQKKAEAARSYYFYQMLNDDISGGLPVLDSSGTKFSDDILNFYFERYYEALNGLDIYDSNGNIFLQAAGFNDTRFSLKLLSFADTRSVVSEGLSPNDLKPHALQSFKDYYNTLLARFLLSQGFDSTDPNPGKSGLDIAPGYVTSDELVECIDLDNYRFFPKGDYKKISYRTDDTFQKWINFPTTPRTDFYRSYIIDNNHFQTGGTEEMYFITFSNQGGTNYYSEYQARLYFEIKTNYDDSGSALSVEKYPRLQVWSNVDGTPSEPIEFFDSTVDCSEYKYFTLHFGISNSYIYLRGYKTYTDFLNERSYKEWSKSNFDKYYNLYPEDFSSSVPYRTFYNGSHHFKGSYELHTSEDCPFSNNCDIGLIASSSPVEFTFKDIDITQIPSNQIITINGDTIYNYTITNPDTGESSKFGDYITNNYTYITNNYGGGSGSSSGSGVGGNVTVGGSIDVGGSVGVDINVSVPDININVNGNGSGVVGSGTSIANPDDFTSAENVDLTKYYDEAVEQSTGFQKFLKDFFGFLPAELLGLILFAVAMAIVCRVFGR